MSLHGFRYAAASIQAAPRTSAPPPPSSGTREHGTPKPPVVDWRDQGACRGKPAELWFANEPASGGLGTSSYLEGRAICASCPVRSECLEWALATFEPFGLWGGVSPRGRAKILRERGLEPIRRRSHTNMRWLR